MSSVEATLIGGIERKLAEGDMQYVKTNLRSVLQYMSDTVEIPNPENNITHLVRCYNFLEKRRQQLIFNLKYILDSNSNSKVAEASLIKHWFHQYYQHKQLVMDCYFNSIIEEYGGES